MTQEKWMPWLPSTPGEIPATSVSRAAPPFRYLSPAKQPEGATLTDALRRGVDTAELVLTVVATLALTFKKTLFWAREAKKSLVSIDQSQTLALYLRVQA